jgi:hypothetical protein
LAFDLPLALSPTRTRRRVSPLAFSLVADLILGDAGIAARLAVDALRLLGFGGWFVAQTGTYELLARVTGHAFCLRIALCHSLLLRVDLGADRRRRSSMASRSTQRGKRFRSAVKSLAFGINELCATGSLFSDQSKGWVLFHEIAQLPKAIIAWVEIG